MTRTPSTMLPLGTEIPEFALPDAASGEIVRSTDLSGRRAVLVMFLCNHCPFVQHVIDEIGRIAVDYTPRDVAIVAINANDVEAYPADAPERMRDLAEEKGWSFPFLFDESQETAKAFRAACTPDFFLFDAEGRLAYRGQLDDSRPGNEVPVTGADLRAALDAVLAGETPPEPQRPSLGCNIKWRPGNAPEYFGS